MIVLPMAGRSERFARAGYPVPKYQLDVHGRSLFRRVVEGFRRCFADESLLVVLRDADGARAFAMGELSAIPDVRAEVVVLERETRGQAETVDLGLTAAEVDEREPVTVFNVDTIRRGFIAPPCVPTCDGFLEVFRGTGAHWSFVQPAPEAPHDRVVRTTEKERISDLCCTGLYGFRSADLFRRYFREADRCGLSVGGELYVAPIYNLLLRDGLDVRWYEIRADEVRFCGTPAEYEAVRAAPDAAFMEA